jgi:hypothetical protein
MRGLVDVNAQPLLGEGWATVRCRLGPSSGLGGRLCVVQWRGREVLAKRRKATDGTVLYDVGPEGLLVCERDVVVLGDVTCLRMTT